MILYSHSREIAEDWLRIGLGLAEAWKETDSILMVLRYFLEHRKEGASKGDGSEMTRRWLGDVMAIEDHDALKRQNIIAQGSTLGKQIEYLLRPEGAKE